MKKTLLAILLFYGYTLSLQAQTLYGVTSKGGNDGGGTIIRFVPSANNLTVAKSFESIAANAYYTNLSRQVMESYMA